MSSSDGVVLTRQPVSPVQIRRRTSSSGSLSYVDPQRRLRSVTLTSIPAEGESEEEQSKRSRSKDTAKHVRSQTTAGIRSMPQTERLVRSMTVQPESITTSSDIEDHIDDSGDESAGGTISGFSTFGGGKSRQISSEYSGQVSDAETEQGDQDLAKRNPRKLTGISPAMRKDFQGRVLQFGPNEDDQQQFLRASTMSAASSVASIAGTHGSVMSPPPVNSRNVKAATSPIARVGDTRTCDTCGRPTATNVLTLMEPCYVSASPVFRHT